MIRLAIILFLLFLIGCGSSGSSDSGGNSSSSSSGGGSQFDSPAADSLRLKVLEQTDDFIAEIPVSWGFEAADLDSKGAQDLEKAQVFITFIDNELSEQAELINIEVQSAKGSANIDPSRIQALLLESEDRLLDYVDMFFGSGEFGSLPDSISATLSQSLSAVVSTWYLMLESDAVISGTTTDAFDFREGLVNFSSTLLVFIDDRWRSKSAELASQGQLGSGAALAAYKEIVEEGTNSISMEIETFIASENVVSQRAMDAVRARLGVRASESVADHYSDVFASRASENAFNQIRAEIVLIVRSQF